MCIFWGCQPSQKMWMWVVFILVISLSCPNSKCYKNTQKNNDFILIRFKMSLISNAITIVMPFSFIVCVAFKSNYQMQRKVDSLTYSICLCLCLFILKCRRTISIDEPKQNGNHEIYMYIEAICSSQQGFRAMNMYIFVTTMYWAYGCLVSPPTLHSSTFMLRN